MELHAVRDRRLKLFLIGRHIPFRTAVNKADMLHAGKMRRSARHIHRRVAAADDHDVLAGLKSRRILLRLHKERQRVEIRAVREDLASGRPRAAGYDHIRKSLRLQLRDGRDLPSGPDLRPERKRQLHIPVDRAG